MQMDKHSRIVIKRNDHYRKIGTAEQVWNMAVFVLLEVEKNFAQLWHVLPN